MASSLSPSSSTCFSNSPCAACKFLRRKCTQECVFAPYFPPEEPQKFVNVHKIFGASNVTKILNDVAPHQREDAVSSLAYEAEARLKDPVYGCVGAISALQNQVRHLQKELAAAHADLLHYSSPSAEIFNTQNSCRSCLKPPYPRLAFHQQMIRDQHQYQQKLLMQQGQVNHNLVESVNSNNEGQSLSLAQQQMLLEMAIRFGGSSEAALAPTWGVANNPPSLQMQNPILYNQGQIPKSSPTSSSATAMPRTAMSSVYVVEDA